MMTLKEIRESLKDKNLSDVGRKLSKPKTRQQMWEIASGLNSNPKAETLEALSDYLESLEDDDQE